MKPVLINIVIMVIFQSAIYTCAKDSDEKNEDESYRESATEIADDPVRTAITEWETFADDSEKLLAIAKSNLNVLHGQIAGADGEHDSFYQKSENEYFLLKKQLAAENRIFTGDPTMISGRLIERNTVFKDAFWKKLIKLNTDLEAALENEFSEDEN